MFFYFVFFILFSCFVLFSVFVFFISCFVFCISYCVVCGMRYKLGDGSKETSAEELSREKK